MDQVKAAALQVVIAGIGNPEVRSSAQIVLNLTTTGAGNDTLLDSLAVVLSLSAK